MNDARSSFLISHRSPGYAPSALGSCRSLTHRGLPGGRRSLVVFLALSLAGCGGSEGGEPASVEGGNPRDSVVASPGFGGDSLPAERGDPLEADAEEGRRSADSPGSRADSAGAASGSPGSEPRVQEDGERAGPPEMEGITQSGQGIPQEIQVRLDRLEAENDSLRAAVGALLGFLGPGPQPQDPGTQPAPSQETRGDSSRSPTDILDVNAQDVQNWGFRIAVAVVFLLLTGLLIRMVIWVLEKLAERNAKRRLLFKRMVPIARISLWFLAILFVAMVVLRIEAQGLIAAGAAVGVAVGFAAQDILKNIFGGLIVLFDQPFQVGDKISVEGTYGEVVSIGLRSTRIVTPDDNRVSVPNSQVVGGQVANANAGELNCQVVTDLYLPGWVDEGRAKRIAFEAAASSKYVYLNKPIVVLVKDEFKETFLTHLKVKAYVLDPRYEFLFMSDVTERARAEFRKTGLLGPMHGARAYVDLDRFPGSVPSTHQAGGDE